MRIKTRIVHLPIAFDDSATLARTAAIAKRFAPMHPGYRIMSISCNVSTVLPARRGSRHDLQSPLHGIGTGRRFSGSALRGAVDPRHRLLRSKYNPARNFTAEGTVGIGGVYMCIYGMDVREAISLWAGLCRYGIRS